MNQDMNDRHILVFDEIRRIQSQKQRADTTPVCQGIKTRQGQPIDAKAKLLEPLIISGKITKVIRCSKESL